MVRDIISSRLLHPSLQENVPASRRSVLDTKRDSSLVRMSSRRPVELLQHNLILLEDPRFHVFFCEIRYLVKMTDRSQVTAEVMSNLEFCDWN
mmetsp:Transcript_21101/g.43861  ORF Transcript_21101/g.43861 Transcript_21101/m.43861 type:complete len:93 (+) Transcript_21101:195-473(+)